MAQRTGERHRLPSEKGGESAAPKGEKKKRDYREEGKKLGKVPVFKEGERKEPSSSSRKICPYWRRNTI